METPRSTRISTIILIDFAPHAARALVYCLLSLLFAHAGASRVDAQVRPAHQSRSQQSRQQQDGQQKTSPSDGDGDEDEGESESATRPGVARARVTDPAAVLRAAHMVFVRSDSIFLSGDEVEDSLRKRKEFQAWGMVITRNETEADLIIEITRKSFTRRFTFAVIDPRTLEVVTSGKTRSVIFGKKIANKIAEKFANRVKVVRPYPPVAASNP
jgi:hypothetical protein